MVTKTTFKKKFPDVKVQKLQTEVVFSRKHVEDTVLQMCGMMGLGLLYYSYSNKCITVYTSEKMKKEWTMEILTALQWAKKGFIPNEGAEGTEQWTNCYYSAKAVYFKDCEVHEDKEAAKAILSAKRKEYRDVAKKREEKRKQNAEYRGKMKTHWQWLQEGRIPDPHARWRVGEELNRNYNTCSYGSKYCYCHERYTHEPKNDEEIQKAILDFHKNGDSWG